MSCNICGQPLHLGCCNPGRPEKVATPQGAPPTEGEIYAAIDRPSLALTDRHIAALAAAVHRAGFIILHDQETGEIALAPSPERLGIATCEPISIDRRPAPFWQNKGEGQGDG